MILLLIGCAGLAGQGELVSSPPEAVVDVNMPTFAALTAEDRALLERHFRSSQRWEIRDEPSRDGRRRLAVRREPHTDEQGRVSYPPGSNGFYSNFQAEAIVQTRVLIGLGAEYGLGDLQVGVTRAAATAGPVQLQLVQDDQPGLWSTLIVSGGAGLTLEIYEQSKALSRTYTSAALREVEGEVEAALGHREQLLAQGYLPDLAPAGSVIAGASPSLAVEDGMQPGMFTFTGWANPGEPGVVYVKATYLGAAKQRPSHIPPELIGHEDEELSAGRLRGASSREIGWSADPNTLFRYEAGGTVYEGGWDDAYRARFELWFQPERGPERALASVERDIAGWQR